MERRRPRQHSLRENLISVAIGIVIGLLLGLGHMHSVQKHQQATASLPSDPAPAVVETVAVTKEPTETPTDCPEPYNDPSIPDDVEEAARAAAAAYDLPIELLEAIAFYESSYQADALNGNCTGLMQVSLYWHQDRMKRLGVNSSQMWDPGPNMMVAADYLAELFSCHSDLYWVLMKYNGNNNAGDYLNGLAAPSEYALKVSELMMELQYRHNE